MPKDNRNPELTPTEKRVLALNPAIDDDDTAGILKLLIARERAGARRERRAFLDHLRADAARFAQNKNIGPYVESKIDWINSGGKIPGRAARVRKAKGGI